MKTPMISRASPTLSSQRLAVATFAPCAQILQRQKPSSPTRMRSIQTTGSIIGKHIKARRLLINSLLHPSAELAGGDNRLKPGAPCLALFARRGKAGGPFKPGFGLSGAVLPLDKVFQPRARVFAPSIPTRSLRLLWCWVPHVSRSLRDVQISGKVAFRAMAFIPPVVILSGAKDLCIFVRIDAWRTRGSLRNPPHATPAARQDFEAGKNVLASRQDGHCSGISP
jgi:hypothetical protein